MAIVTLLCVSKKKIHFPPTPEKITKNNTKNYDVKTTPPDEATKTTEDNGSIGITDSMVVPLLEPPPPPLATHVVELEENVNSPPPPPQ